MEEDCLLTKEEIGKIIFKECYIIGEFKLRSGLISNEYFDKYQFETNSFLLYSISRLLLREIQRRHIFHPALFAGLETGGIPIATMLSYLTGLKCVFVRKQKKEYGTQKLAEGPLVEGEKLIIIEDVITTGGQVIESVIKLRKEGAVIKDVFCVIDREQGGKENLKKVKLNLYNLFTMKELKKIGKK